MHRYEPFSGANRLHDAPIFQRAGSTVLRFLEPTDIELARPAQASSSTSSTEAPAG